MATSKYSIVKYLFFISVLSLLSLSETIATNPAEVIYSKTTINISSGRMDVHEETEILILNRAGDIYGSWSLQYQKKNKIKNLVAEIKDENGNLIRRIKSSEISSVSAISDISLYEDDLALEFNLKHNEYPYIVHLSYNQSFSEYPMIPDWPDLNDIPVRKATLTLTTPQDYELKFYEQNITPHKKAILNGIITYNWECSYTDPVRKEHYSPSILKYQPSVSIVPLNFIYGVPGSTHSWARLGEWQEKLNSGSSDLNLYSKLKVKELIKHTETDIEKVKILYNYLQDNTRYINVSLGIGGLKTYPASYVVENNYGDCKALSNYMKSLLEAADIKSFYTIISAGSKIPLFYNDFPSLQFNHIIVVVPLKDDTVWLECTDKNSPFNYLGTFTQGREALVVDGSNSRLIKTPALAPEDVLNINSMNLHIHNSDQVFADVKMLMRGSNFEQLSYLSANANKFQFEKIIAENFPLQDFEPFNFSIEERNRNSKELILNSKAKSSTFKRTYGDEIHLSVRRIFSRGFENPADRKLDLLFSYPVSVIDTFRFHLNDKYEQVHLPQDTDISNNFGKFRIKTESKEDLIEIVREFTIYAGYYPKEEYESFYRFLKDSEKSDSNILIIKQSVN